MLAQVSAAAESIVRPQTSRSGSCHHLNIGISAGALFDTRATDRIAAQQGEAAFRDHARATAQQSYAPGAAFPFVQKLLAFNATKGVAVKLTILSHGSPHIAERINHSLIAHGLVQPGAKGNVIAGAAYTGGGPITPPMLSDFGVDFFISRHAADVRDALAAGKAAGLVRSQRTAPVNGNPDIVLAFDLDRALQRPLAQVIELFEPAAAAIARRKWHARPERPLLLDQLEDGMPRGARPGSVPAFLAKTLRLRHHLAIAAPDEGQIHLMGVSAEPKMLPRVMQALRGWQADLDKFFVIKPLGQIPFGTPADLLIDDSAKNPAGSGRVRANIWLPWDEKRLEQGMPRALISAEQLRQVVGPNRPAANTPLDDGNKPRVR